MFYLFIYTINYFYIQFYTQFSNLLISNFSKTIKRGGGSTENECGCSFLSQESEEDNVFRSEPGNTDQMCIETEILDTSPNRSLLSGLPQNGKSVSGVSGGLTCWYTNATSLNKEKLNELRAECLDTDYDIRFVSETWFNDQSVVTIDGYDCFRRDRKDKKGGGVCIYTRISDSLSFRETNYDQLNSSSIEQVWCVVDTGMESILLGCIYRPKIIKDNKGVVGSLWEHKIRDGEIDKSIKCAKGLIKKGIFQGMILAGDFNYGELSWNLHLEPEILLEAESSNNFLDTLNDCFLTQNVFFKTFQQEYSRLTNLLDLIITESKERVYELKPGRVLGGKEHGHLSMSWKYVIKNECANSFGDNYRRTKFNFKKGNYVGMGEFFDGIRWLEILENKNVVDCYKIFSKKFDLACELFVPKINLDKKRKTKPPWLSKELRSLMRVKSNLWHAFVANGRKSEELYDKYKVLNKLVKSELSASISKFELDLARNCAKNPKKLFNYINNKQKVKESIRSLNSSEGITTSNKSEMTEILNDQFESVFSVDDGTDPAFDERTEQVCDVIGLIKREDIKTRLNKLDCNKAPGRDKVSQFVLKNCSEQLSVVLEIIFGRSLLEGEIPDEWREANITPLFKKGSKLNASNYRPVSLTSVCCKLMEGIMRDRIMSHLVKHKLISPSQHGFVHKKSCVTNLLECHHVVSGLLNNGKSVDVLYTDFEKAFDKVSHKKLITKLYGYGIRGTILVWIESFLRNRRQRVVMGEFESGWRDILSGVPQGSVLGPLLFVVYINDLPDGLENMFKMYADDSKVISEVDGFLLDSNLQRDINKIKDWCDKWSMCLNSSKCKVMHFGKKNPEKDYYIGHGPERVLLGKTENEKDLGVLIDNSGKSSRQVQAAVSKANSALGRMRATFQFFNIELFKILYPTFVRPHLEFGSSAWNSMSKADTKKLEGIQKRATKMVIELRAMEYEERLEVLGLTTLETRRKRGDLIQIFKIFRGIENVDMGVVYSQGGPNGRHHNYQITRERQGNVPMRNGSLLNRNATTWNLLPSEIVEADTVSVFKTRLDRHIKSDSLRRSVYRV